MTIDINWFAVLVCIVAGQVFLTLWFTLLFGEPWARAYGAADRQTHTEEVPGYTYAIGILCTATLTLGLAVVQSYLQVSSVMDALGVGLFLALCFFVATSLPGHAFQRRWSMFAIATGAQTLLILLISTVLVLWP